MNKSTLVLREILVEAAMGGHDPKQLVGRLAERLQQAPKLIVQLMIMMFEAEIQLSQKPPSPFPDSYPLVTDAMTELQAAAAYNTMLEYNHGLAARGLLPRVTERMLEEMSEETAAQIYHAYLSDEAIASDRASRSRSSKP